MSQSNDSLLAKVGAVYSLICQCLSTQEKYTRLTILSKHLTKQLSPRCFKYNCTHVRPHHHRFPHSVLRHILIASSIECDSLSNIHPLDYTFLHEQLIQAFETNSVLKQVIIREPDIRILDTPLLKRLDEVLQACEAIKNVQSLIIILGGIFNYLQAGDGYQQLKRFEWRSLTKFVSLTKLNISFEVHNRMWLPLRAILAHLPHTLTTLALTIPALDRQDTELDMSDITSFDRLYHLDKLSIETGTHVLHDWAKTAAPARWPPIHALRCQEPDISLIFQLQSLVDLSLSYSMFFFQELNTFEMEFTDMSLPHLERCRIHLDANSSLDHHSRSECIELWIQVISRGTKLRELQVCTSYFVQLTDRTVGHLASCSKLQSLSLHLHAQKLECPDYVAFAPPARLPLFHSRSLDTICLPNCWPALTVLELEIDSSISNEQLQSLIRAAPTLTRLHIDIRLEHDRSDPILMAFFMIAHLCPHLVDLTLSCHGPVDQIVVVFDYIAFNAKFAMHKLGSPLLTKLVHLSLPAMADRVFELILSKLDFAPLCYIERVVTPYSRSEDHYHTVQLMVKYLRHLKQIPLSWLTNARLNKLYLHFCIEHKLDYCTSHRLRSVGVFRQHPVSVHERYGAPRQFRSDLDTHGRSGRQAFFELLKLYPDS